MDMHCIHVLGVRVIKLTMHTCIEAEFEVSRLFHEIPDCSMRSILLHIQTIQSILYLRMYMRHCHAYILVNKSHNNAVVTNNFFLLVYVIILFALYILHIYYYGILRGGGGRYQCAPLCMQPCIIITAHSSGYTPI